jgi:hypothetical protein
MRNEFLPFLVKMLSAFFAVVVLIDCCPIGSNAADMLVPMDLSQTNHLKAYGVAYHALQHGYSVRWLLNYRGGSFLMPMDERLILEARLKDVHVEQVSGSDIARIYDTIEKENMDVVLLEKAPKIAVYTPPNKQPWDDAVTLALTYAEIPFDKVFDEEVLAGKLAGYDWLHLHHEDFTGQYGKFYGSFRYAEWYRMQQVDYEARAKKLGFSKVSDEKKAVAEKIREYVLQGGFLFAMCSACDTIDIALAARGVDIAAAEFDHDGVTPGYQERLDYSRCFAFTGFRLITDPFVY